MRNKNKVNNNICTFGYFMSYKCTGYSIAISDSTEHLLSTYYRIDTVVSAGDTKINKA